MIHSKPFLIKDMVTKWTKEINKENQQDGVNRTTDILH